VCHFLRALSDPSQAEHIAHLYADIYAVVRRIPKGRVLTYGQLAELAGRPGAARLAGAAMRAMPEELGLPWQRVIGKKSKGTGKVSIHDPIGGAIQRQMLEAEGVVFSDAGSVKLADFGWIPS
jgi:methylated-DNA-protein-cysteine methyltransferase-like protein